MALRCSTRWKRYHVYSKLGRIPAGSARAQSTYQSITDDNEKASVLEGEEYYKYFLDVAKVRLPRFAPVARLFRRDPVECETTLPELFKEDPLKVLNEDFASFAAVTNCLGAYILRMRRIPKQARRHRHLQNEPGTAALDWLLRTKAHQSLELLRSSNFIHLLGFLLAGQGISGEAGVWDFLKSSDRGAYHEVFGTNTCSVYRSAILRNFIGYVRQTQPLLAIMEVANRRQIVSLEKSGRSTNLETHILILRRRTSVLVGRCQSNGGNDDCSYLSHAC
jgi:hypothetical protein